MKRNDKGNPLKKDAPHTRIYRWMTGSQAWKHLTPNARALYMALKEKYTGNNNGRLIFSIRDASTNLNIGKTTADKAFRELGAHGFIEVVIKGSFGGRKDGKATEYRLDEAPCDVSNAIPQKRFMRWRPGEDFHGPPSGTHSTRERTVSTRERTVRSA